MKPFVSGPCEGELKYTLYGVLVHDGASIDSGSDYCFVRTSPGMWHSLDDNKVSQVSEKTVLDQKAYMLFYVRDKQQPLRSSDLSEASQNAKRKRDCTKELTRGLPETVVTKWDEEVSASKKMGKSEGTPRGKKKKIKSKR